MNLNTKSRTLINILNYYLAWWGIAVFARLNNLIAILLNLIFYLALHFFLIVPNDKKIKANEIKFIVIFAAVGMFIDFSLHYLKFFTLKEHYVIWLYSIWVIFSTTINFSLKYFFQQNSIMVFIVGGVAGPISYFVASKFSLIIYSTNLLNLLIHFFIWGGIVLSLKYKRNFYEQIS